MKKNKFVGDFLIVLVSNGIVLLGNILTGLFIPKMLGVTNYGYYKIYTLYLSYTALLHFGFADGILLRHGGEEYAQLDRKEFRLNTCFFAITQGIIAFIISLVATIIFRGVYRFIALMIATDMVANNITTYYQFISQCTMRFNELSVRKILQAGLKAITVLLFYVLYKIEVINVLSAYVYIVSLVLMDILLAGWYMITYKDLTFGERAKFNENSNNILNYYKTGFILTIAYQVSNLVFNLDRQFVSVLFDTETYSIYSFAYTLISMFNTVIGAISLVLFPTLKRRGTDQIMLDLPKNMSIIEIIVFGAHIGYIPLSAFINWYLPEYDTSLSYLRIIFPGLALSSCITSILFTYYKVMKENFKYFKICVIILILSALTNAGAYFVFKTPESISCASVLSLLIWYIVGEFYFIKNYQVKWKKNLAYVLIMMSIFYIVTLTINNSVVATLVYIAIYLMVTLAMYNKVLISEFRFLL